jgi:enoyl-CoA hydratase
VRGRADRCLRSAGGKRDGPLARSVEQACRRRGRTLVRFDRDEHGLAVATFDSPPLNLFNRQLFEDLQAIVAAVEAEPPRALLFRAEGRAVSGGVDVHEFDGLTPERASQLWDELIGLVEKVEALPLPVVFAAHALTLTAAFELALGCDLILAARSAKFGLVEKVVGLTPSMGGTQRLAERAGSGRARHFVMSGELFDAEEMERWGVVNLVFDDKGFDDRARAFAAELAAGPTKAHAMTKHVLRRYREGGVPAADQAIREDAGELFATEDLQRAVKTFLEKGPGHAEFNGR